MTKTAIKIENLSKVYRLGEVGTGTLSHDLNRFWRMNILGQDDPYAKVGHVNDRTARAEKGELVAALRDINLEVQQGEVLGIIGKNGAGKSTLLKILSRVTSPTTGSIKVRGRLASLLEVGTGFHPEMTGRENIYMNGTIMGMRRWEIDRKLDEIVDFSGVAKYLDTPTKRYSSGMTVRLGFAIAAHLEPEILVVDEVLAVGDAEFQKKAIGKMQEVSTQGGRTVLFVSHNMGAVKQLCNRGIILNHGIVTLNDTANKAVDSYHNDLTKNKTYELKNRNDRKGNGWLRFTNIELKNENNVIINDVLSGDKVKFEISYKKLENFNDSKFIFSFIIYNLQEQIVASFPSDELKGEFRLNKNGKLILEIDSLNLRPEKYYISLYSFFENTTPMDYIDTIENVFSFTIHPSDYYKTGKLVRHGNYGLLNAIYHNI